MTYGITCVRDGAILGFGAMWPVALVLLAIAAILFVAIAIVLTRRAREL